MVSNICVDSPICCETPVQGKHNRPATQIQSSNGSIRKDDEQITPVSKLSIYNEQSSNTEASTDYDDESMDMDTGSDEDDDNGGIKATGLPQTIPDITFESSPSITTGKLIAPCNGPNAKFPQESITSTCSTANELTPSTNIYIDLRKRRSSASVYRNPSDASSSSSTLGDSSDYPIDPLLFEGSESPYPTPQSIDSPSSTSATACQLEETSLHGDAPPLDNLHSNSTFDEWPLSGATLKCVNLDGKRTFQIQFTMPLYVGHNSQAALHADEGSGKSQRPQTLNRRGRRQRAGNTRVRWKPEEDTLLRDLKQQGLSWVDIYSEFQSKYPGRSIDTLRVRYSSKVMRRTS